MPSPSYVGIDVSGDFLDIHVLSPEQSFRVRTDDNGFAKLVRKLTALSPTLVVLEATGGLETRVVRRLVLADLPVVVANPRQVRQFARAKGITAKTDAIDARVIALFGEAVKPEVRPLPDDQQLQFREFLDRREQLIKLRTAEQNRRKRTHDPWIITSHDQMITVINVQLQEIDDDLDRLTRQTPAWQEKADLLQSVPGIGPTVARVLIGYLWELGTINRHQVAALAGLAPFNRDSGTYRGKRMIQGGRAAVRRALYMAAVASLRCNQRLKQFYDRLKEQGKTSKQALIAVARKLLVILNSMMKTNTSWRPLEA